MIAQARKVVVRGVALATVGGIVLACPVSGQQHRRIEIAPALGAFLPFGAVPVPEFLGCPAYCQAPSLRETRTVALGGRVTAWLGKRAAIEGSIFYGPSGVADGTHYTSSPDPGYGAQGKVVLTSLRALLSVAAPVPTMSVLLMAGPAVIHQFGGGWPDWNSPTSFGGMLGVGLDVHRVHTLPLRAAIEDYVYSWESPMGAYYGSHSHHDVVFSLSAGPSFFGQRGERH